MIFCAALSVMVDVLIGSKISFFWLLIAYGIAAMLSGYYAWKQYLQSNIVDGVGPGDRVS
jgi:hypothetical protein